MTQEKGPPEQMELCAKSIELWEYVKHLDVAGDTLCLGVSGRLVRDRSDPDISLEPSI